MASNIKLKNSLESELSIEHSDNEGAVEITSTQLKNIRQVDTIADLRAMTDTQNTIWVSGYHTKDDGAFGSNIFRWNPTSIDSDNGGTIIKLDGVETGRYELQYDGAVNVRWFGAIGDVVSGSFWSDGISLNTITEPIANTNSQLLKLVNSESDKEKKTGRTLYIDSNLDFASSPLVADSLNISHKGSAYVHGYESKIRLDSSSVPPGEDSGECASFASFIRSKGGGSTRYGYVSHLYNDVDSENPSDKPLGLYGIFSEIFDNQGVSGSQGTRAFAAKSSGTEQTNTAYLAYGDSGFSTGFDFLVTANATNGFRVYNSTPSTVSLDKGLFISGAKASIDLHTLGISGRVGEVVTDDMFDVIYDYSGTTRQAIDCEKGVTSFNSISSISLGEIDSSSLVVGNNTVDITYKGSIINITSESTAGKRITNLSNSYGYRQVTFIGNGGANPVSFKRNNALAMSDSEFFLLQDYTITFIKASSGWVEVARSTNTRTF